MHVHSNPDLRLRAYDDFELMEAGIRVGARAIVIKTHQGATMDRAFLCNRHNKIVHGNTNDFTMFGSLTLNRTVGGINPSAAESCLKLGAKVVWLPTQSARNHLEKNRQDTKGCVEVVRDGKIVPELKDVFVLLKEHNAVLGTAHISPEEAFPPQRWELCFADLWTPLMRRSRPCRAWTPSAQSLRFSVSGLFFLFF